jgi:hypothetical protein
LPWRPPVPLIPYAAAPLFVPQRLAATVPCACRQARPWPMHRPGALAACEPQR